MGDRIFNDEVGASSFDISLAPMDRVRAEIVVERKQVLSESAYECAGSGKQQIVSGVLSARKSMAVDGADGDDPFEAFGRGWRRFGAVLLFRSRRSLARFLWM